MAPIRLHDTRSGELRELVPRSGGRVGIYACGPTVYGRIHVGNARPFVVYSLLKRFLEHEGLDLALVINIAALIERGHAYALGLVDGESPAEMRPPRDAFFAALADDFNTAVALGALFEWIHEREVARAARNHAEADRLRDELHARGWEVRDGPHAPELVRIEQ